MTLLNILQFHPFRDTLPDGTELRLVLPVERTNNKPLYITSDGRPFSHVYVKDKTTGDYHFEYHPLKPIFDTSKINKFNGNRKQKYLKMTRTYGIVLHRLNAHPDEQLHQALSRNQTTGFHRLQPQMCRT